MVYSPFIEKIVERLRRFPGIGTRSAERIVFFLLTAQRNEIAGLMEDLRLLGERVRPCTRCGNLADSEPCFICKDSGRDNRVICVVEEPADLYAIERTSQFRGQYHVLGGVLSPIAGVGPKDLKIDGLEKRVEHQGVEELIIATNPSTEGEATALYLARLFRKKPVRLSRIAHGIPVGGNLSYVDPSTMGKAFEGRRPLTSSAPG